MIGTASIERDSEPAFDVAGDGTIPAFQVEVRIKVEILATTINLYAGSIRRCQTAKQAQKTGQHEQFTHDEHSSEDRILAAYGCRSSGISLGRRKLYWLLKFALGNATSNGRERRKHGVSV